MDTNKAAAAPAGPGAGGAGEYLSLRLGAEEYGIGILSVQEIRGYEAPTRIVNAPAHVLGVVNLRGVIVPVLDMRIQFGITAVDYTDQTVTIVLNVGERVVGMVVDAVLDVVALKAQDIRPAPEFRGSVAADNVLGLATLRQGGSERMLILLDIHRLLANADQGLVARKA